YFLNTKDVNFSLGDTVKFSSEFSVLSDYQIDIVGKSSGASYSINGSSSNLNDAYWLGNSDNIFFKQYEWCDITLSFNNYDTILSDSVLILGERDLSNLGLLLTSFEDPSEYSIVTSSNNDEFNVYSNSNIALHGNNYLNTLGIGNAAWFGAVRFSFNSNTITETDPNNIFFNGFFNSDYIGSAFVIKVFEDENANGSYDSGIDEAYALKVYLNTDSQWHKYCHSFSNFIIDQSGNNILVDGILNPKNIIRIDITNSQSGSANGQFGYLADYFLITYNEPL
ncbi:hypothetical protein N9T75_01000, partial [Bacteroidota bacterium]|nr:hypothetical protein [Bacteroidota bacterium]